MEKLTAWVREHRWESVSIGLAIALVLSLISLAVVATGDDPAPEATDTTTTVPGISTTTSTFGATTTSTGSNQAPIETTTTLAPQPTDLRSTAVIVDNAPDVGLQIGIDAAEILIEVPVEGGMTRYTAIFGANVPELVGPVRSLRPVSADLLALFDPVLFSTGGQPFVTGMVADTGARMISPDSSSAYQSLERPRPHHLFVTPSIESLPATVDITPWEWGEWAGGDAADVVELAGGVEWRFEGGSYAKYNNGSPVEVLPSFNADPVPLARDTIIVMEVNQKSAGYLDSAGFEVPTFDVIGSGAVFVYHKGEVVEGLWSRADQDEAYVFALTDGTPLLIPSAQVVVALLPGGGSS